MIKGLESEIARLMTGPELGVTQTSSRTAKPGFPEVYRGEHAKGFDSAPKQNHSGPVFTASHSFAMPGGAHGGEGGTVQGDQNHEH